MTPKLGGDGSDGIACDGEGDKIAELGDIGWDRRDEIVVEGESLQAG